MKPSNDQGEGVVVASGPGARLHRMGIPFVLMALLVAVPILSTQLAFFDSFVTVKGLVGILESAFVVVVLLGHRCTGNRSFPTHMLLLTLLAWGVLTTALSSHVAAAIVRQSEWVAHALFAYSVYIWISVDPARILHVARLALAGFLLYLVHAVPTMFPIPDVDGMTFRFGIPGFSNIRHLGYYATACIPLSLLVCGNSSSGRTDRLLAAAALMGAWFVIFWAGGRGPIAALLAGTLFIAITPARAVLAKRWKVLMGTGVFGYLLALALDPTGGGPHRMWSAFARVTDGVDIESGRLSIWHHGLSVVLEHPWTGLGPDGYMFIAPGNALLVQVHNSLLQAALEWGLPGLLLVTVPALSAAAYGCWAVCQPCIPQREAARYPTGCAISWLMMTLLAFSFVDGTLYHAQPLVMFAISAGTIAAILRPATTTNRGVSPVVPIVLVCINVVFMLHLISTYAALNTPLDDYRTPLVVQMMPSGLADARVATRQRQRIERCMDNAAPQCLELVQFTMAHSRAHHRQRIVDVMLRDRTRN